MEADTNIEEELTTTSSVRLNPIKICEYILSHNGVIPPEDLGDGYFSETSLNPEIVKEAIDEEVVNSSADEERYSTPELTLSPEFDWDSESRRSLRDAIDFLFRNNFVNKDQLVRASKYAGPNSVTTLEHDDAFIGMLSLKGYANFAEFKQARRLTREEVLKSLGDESRIVRNIFTALILYKNQIINLATELRNQYELDISSDDAVRSIMTQVAAHEYGHAISHGEKSDGRDIEEVCALHTEDDELKSLLLENEDMRSEYFAIGVGDIVLRGFLEKAGIPPEKIFKIFSDEEEAGKRCLQSYLGISKRMQEAQYHNFMFVDSTIQAACPKGARLVSMDTVLTYNTGRFPESVIKKALSSDTSITN